MQSFRQQPGLEGVKRGGYCGKKAAATSGQNGANFGKSGRLPGESGEFKML